MNYGGKRFIISWPTSTTISCPCDKLKGQVEAMKWSISSCEGIYQQEQELKYMSSQPDVNVVFILGIFMLKRKKAEQILNVK